MAEPVRARRLSEDEGRRLQQIVRRGKHGSGRVRRALIIMAAASGTPVPAIARLGAADEDTVGDVIHAFNDRGLHALDPQWAGGRPRLIDDEDITFIVATATARPKTLGLPFTRWSVRKLGAYLSGSYQYVEPGLGLQRMPGRRVRIGRERLRQVLRDNDITFQRTRTWKQSTDGDFDAKLDRIEHVASAFPDRCFAFDQFGPLSIRPHHGSGWARASTPDRLPATYRRTHGIRYFHGCYSLADDQLWGVVRARKGGDHPGRAEEHPRRQTGRRPGLRDPGQPVREHHPGGAQVGGGAQPRVVSDPDLQFVGQPHRGPVRAAAHLHDGELELPQPHRPGPGPAGPPALAQHPRPTPRRPGRPTPRTRPHPQRERPPLGTTQDQGRGRLTRRTFLVTALGRPEPGTARRTASGTSPPSLGPRGEDRPGPRVRVPQRIGYREDIRRHQHGRDPHSVRSAAGQEHLPGEAAYWVVPACFPTGDRRRLCALRSSTQGRLDEAQG